MREEDVQKILAGIVHGETRTFVGNMTIQEIFSDREAFRKHVVGTVQKDLEQYGLEIHNANIEDMRDMPGNAYFENLEKKALEEANTTSRVSVSEAKKEGDIGEKNREVETRKQKSVLEADAKQTETTQNQKMSDYSRDLTITVTTNKQKEKMIEIDAHKATESRKIEVESELNKQRQAQELERLRSEQVVKTTAQTEALIKQSEGDSNALKIKAAAEAEATKLRAMGEAEAIKMKAEAMYFEKMKTADAIKATLEAQANGLEKLYEASKTNPEMANFYLALDKGVFNKDGLFSVIADKQALAIKDMHPDIRIWNTGTQGTGNNYTDAIASLSKSVPPILDAIQQQTGIKLPGFSSDLIKKVIDEANKA